MKYLTLTIFFFCITACSFNDESKYWTEDPIKKKINDQKLIEIIEKSSDIRKLTIKEYSIYIEDYVKKSSYPDLTK